MAAFVDPATGKSQSTSSAAVSWQTCLYCPAASNSGNSFRSPQEYAQHLRLFHCVKEGGSYVCKYGPHNVCLTLPLEGVADRDYVDHVRKVHIGGSSITADSSNTSVVETSTKADHQNSSPWTLYSCTQNLPSILNDPRKTRREMAVFFTRHWGDYFVERTDVPLPGHLPRITDADFEHYLNTIGRRYRLLKKEERRLFSSRRSQDSTISSLTEQKSGGYIQDKSQIPSMFFSSKFSLDDPHYFRILFTDESSQPNDLATIPDIQLHTAKTSADTGKLKPSKLMLEKLTHYLDIVEIDIARQVAARSSSFFDAMTSHDELQQELQQTKTSVQVLRGRMQRLDQTLAVRPLRLLRLKSSRANCEDILKKLELMTTVRQTQSMVQMLLNSSDYLGALELIATTQAVLSEELANIICFRHLSTQLNELEAVISKMLQEEFVKFVKLELTKPVLDESQLVLDEVQLTSLILGLLRVREYRFFVVLKEEIASAIKNMVRDCIREYVSGSDVDAAEGSLADQMRKLDFELWLALMESLINQLILFCRKVNLICGILSDVLDITARRRRPPCSASYGSNDRPSQIDYGVDGNSIGQTPLPVTENLLSPVVSYEFFDISIGDADDKNLRENLFEIVPQTCTSAQERCVRVLNARAKDSFLERLTVEEFLRLSRAVERFVDGCETLSKGRKIYGMRSCLQMYASKLAHRFHEDRKTKLGNVLDTENWKRADVPALFQELVDQWTKTGSFYDILPTEQLKLRPPQSFLMVNGEKFVVVGTALLLMQTMAQYCQFVDQMPSLSADLLTRLVEILKNFNSRTCQLILGAGALQLVGLKTISAKNLALALRCLQLIILFIPATQKHFDGHLPPAQSQMTRHLVQVLKDYENHVDEISSRMFGLVEDQFIVCLRKWEVKPPSPSPCFQQIVKVLKRFHDGIGDILPSGQLQKLFLRLHDKFKSLLRQELKQLRIGPQDGALYTLVCSEYSFYMENLKSLPCCAAVDDSLQDVLSGSD